MFTRLSSIWIQDKWKLRFLASSRTRQWKPINELDPSSKTKCCDWCGFCNKLSSQPFCATNHSLWFKTKRSSRQWHGCSCKRFGLARLLPITNDSSGKQTSTIGIKGSIGYVAPGNLFWTLLVNLQHLYMHWIILF